MLYCVMASGLLHHITGLNRVVVAVIEDKLDAIADLLRISAPTDHSYRTKLITDIGDN